MKKTLLPLIPLLVLSTWLSAATLTVDNNAGAVAMYSSLGTAISEANPGDTILIAGSPTIYGDHSIHKELHFVGVGYFKGTNGIAGLNNHASHVHLRFKNNPTDGDSSGSSVTGTYGLLSSEDDVTGLVVDKCYTDNWSWDFRGQVTVTRCYSRNWIMLYEATSSVSNSISLHIRLAAGGATATNCVIRQAITQSVTGTNFTNCIFMTTNPGHWDNDPDFDYCINVGGSFLPASPTNTNGALQASVITGVGADNTDQHYMLSEGSIAIGEGFNGADIGAYGGDDPYQLSGIPGRPRMTRFTLPPTATGLTAVTVEVEAEAHPE